ncbi:trehalose-6-phosphate synthase, putative [Perkinsus marinus ATCC 50983]|uniref:Trehalose-6-phosphate synthase, putative n=1 Tax=Perkinsus marinus (strain ATCC 50983 / TXsc) TaxID=423536 RepID=C5LK55_PERM5|nr:trehalose-6-phosphate synthase, putative [Perkinsus marinus ATCC 50983]EER02842.1 trehalose-6-phosphate synthase, putative [Perkinsus marinus ATCC 50983]|eukprot:XP_002771026.1 trehalose-6-phosphate synthase, putative [Perkinsus marinus ATCC 50983]
MPNSHGGRRPEGPDVVTLPPTGVLSPDLRASGTHHGSGCFTRCHFHFANDAVEVGDTVRVVGGHPSLGSWDYKKGLPLCIRQALYPCWFTVEPAMLPLMRVTEYAYVTVGPSGNLKSWERTDADQRVIRQVIPSGMEMTIEDDDGLYRYLLTRGAAARLQQADTTTASGSSGGAVDSASLESGAAGRDPSSGELHIPLRPSGPSQESLPRVRSAFFDASITLTPEDCVVFVSIQLPVLVCRKAGGGFEVYPSRYVSMSTLHAVKNELNPKRSLFVGWPGLDYLSKEEQDEVRRVLKPYDCIPVFSSDPEQKRRGPQPARHGFEEFLDFCQTFLWPTVNDQVPLVHNSEDLMTFDVKLWDKYVYWVNDYHLLLVPMLLRKGLRKSQRGWASPPLSPSQLSPSGKSPAKKPTIGLFLHTPFPTSEIFLTLPVRTQVMQSLLAADLVGFQFFDYARHFLTVVKKLVGRSSSCRQEWSHWGGQVLVTVGHASTQFELIAAQMRAPEVLRRIKELKTRFAGKTIICGVDRLGRLSGILLKLRTFRQFLKVYPAYRNKVVLVQLAVSRTTTTHTSPENRITLAKRVGRSEVFFSKFLFMGPHVFFYAGDIETEDRLATMAVSDLLLDTSLKDGLNLTPFDCVLGHQGALLGRVVCSEFSGCSQVLTGSLRVNPWDTEKVLNMLDESLSLPLQELTTRFARDISYVTSHSLLRWAQGIINDLARCRAHYVSRMSNPDADKEVAWGVKGSCEVLAQIDDHNFFKLDVPRVVRDYSKAKRRIFFLDNEGTLAPDLRRMFRHSEPEVNRESNVLMSHGNPPSAAVLDSLSKLCSDPRNTVVILSGREKSLLQDWFGSVRNIGLAAEHGYYWKLPPNTMKRHVGKLGEEANVASPVGPDGWACLLPEASEADAKKAEWKALAGELMRQYVSRTQNSFVENKGSALAKNLYSSLEEYLKGYDVEVTMGKGYVEAKLRGVNKGLAVQTILAKLATAGNDQSPDFVMCIGDDRSDE